ncbi:O-antigen ligase family protein [Vibrio sp. F74]
MALAGMMYEILYLEGLDRRSFPLSAIPFANFIAILALLNYYIFDNLVSSRRFSFISFGTTIILLTSVLLTETRGTWLAITVAALFIAFIKKDRFISPKKIIITIIIFTFSIFASSHYIKKQYNETKIQLDTYYVDKSYSSLSIRLHLWRAGLNIIADSPSLIGLGQSEHIAIIQRNTPPSNPLSWFDNKNFHNSYIDRTVKYGFIGLGIFLTFLGYPFYRGLKEKDPRLKIPLITLPIFISVAALTYVPLSHPGTFFLYIFIMHYYIQASDMAREKRLEATNA